MCVCERTSDSKMTQAFRKAETVTSCKTYPIIKLCVHRHDEDDGSVTAAQWSQQQEICEIGVV